MSGQPSITTQRLRLRPFVEGDAGSVQRLAGAREVADTTLHIPHPYLDGTAETWIRTHAPGWERGELLVYAITSPTDLIGAIALGIQPTHRRAELGYWIGVSHWGQGYCTEAARAVIRMGFERLDLHRIHATHLTRNPASGRVMIKAGMTHEGRLRQHILKWDRFEDVDVYGILRPGDDSRDLRLPG